MTPLPVTNLFRTVSHLLCLITSSACVVVGCCAADSSIQATPAGDAENVTTSVQNIRTSGLEPLRRIMITRGTNELQLVAPQELRIDASSPGEVTFTACDFKYYISVRIIPPQSGLAKDKTSKPDSSWVLARYSGARVTDEFSIPIGETNCKVFSFTWTSNGVRDRIGRIGLVQTAAGLVEFEMLADPQQAKAAADDFHAVMLSLQTNENGAIKFPSVPDHS